MSSRNRNREKQSNLERAYNDARAASDRYRLLQRNSLINRYRNLWFSRFSFDGVTRETANYVMRMFWEVGRFMAFPIVINGAVDYIGSPAYLADSSKILFFAPASCSYRVDSYNNPVAGIPTRSNGNPNIPERFLFFGKDAVLMKCMPDGLSIFEVISPLVEELIDLKMAMRTNRKASQVIPVYAVDDDNAMIRARLLMDAIEHDTAFPFIPVRDVNAIQGVGAGAPMVLAELRSQYIAVDNSILTFLGVDNVGLSTKAERNTIDEVNANNSLVNLNRLIVSEEVKKCFAEIKEVLGFDVAVTDNAERVSSVHEEINEGQTGEEGGNEND